LSGNVDVDDAEVDRPTKPDARADGVGPQPRRETSCRRQHDARQARRCESGEHGGERADHDDAPGATAAPKPRCSWSERPRRLIHGDRGGLRTAPTPMTSTPWTD